MAGDFNPPALYESFVDKTTLTANFLSVYERTKKE
jgi:hypothetical protein